MLGLVFIAPGIAAAFALVGALIGLATSLAGYLVFRLTGGRLGSEKVNLAGTTGGALRAATSPAMLVMSGVLSLVGTYAGLGWYYGEWSLMGQLTKTSGETFDIQEPGPMAALLGGVVGLSLGRLLAGVLLASAPNTTEPGGTSPGGQGCRANIGPAMKRWGLTVAMGAITTAAALSASYGTANPARLAVYVGGWFTTRDQATIDLSGNGADAATPQARNPQGQTPTGNDQASHVAVARHGHWATYRGGLWRTGGLTTGPDDPSGVVGPTGPEDGRVLWAYGHGGSMQFLSAPAVSGEYVMVGGTDGGAAGALYILQTADKGGGERQLVGRRELMGLPTGLAMPVFSPPAIAGGHLYVGEGLHQHTRTRLRKLNLAARGSQRVVWELPVDSHLESGPAVVGKRLYTGAGDAGVLCVATEEIATAPTEDPDTGLTESARPRVIWQQRFADAAATMPLHCDSSPAVVGEAVVVTSGRFREDNGHMVGDSSVVCLEAASGRVRWRFEVSAPDDPRPLNPWGSAAVRDGVVIVGCSDCRFTPAALADSRGAVIALDLANGRELWRSTGNGIVWAAGHGRAQTSEVSSAPSGANGSSVSWGGVLSSVALTTDNRVVFCHARGLACLIPDPARPRVMRVDFTDRRFMAPPTLANDTAFVVDTAGLVTAYKLTGTGFETVWNLDLATALGRRAGVVYGAPAVANGRLYLGTDAGWFVAIGSQ